MIASDGVTALGASAKETLPCGEPGAGQWPLGSLCGTRQRLRARPAYPGSVFRQGERLQHHSKLIEDLEVGHVRRRPDEPKEGVSSHRKRERQDLSCPQSPIHNPRWRTDETRPRLPDGGREARQESPEGDRVGMGDPNRDKWRVLGPGQGDNGDCEVVLCHGELVRFRSKVGKDGQRSQPAQGAGHAPPCRPVDQSRSDDTHPARPGRPLNGQLGAAIVLASPRVRRHRRQRDRPVNPLRESSIEQRDGAEDVRPPDIGPLREGHVVGAMNQ